MEISLAHLWWQKLGSLRVLALVGLLACFTYIFDPPAYQTGSYPGLVLSVQVVEHSKTGFEQIGVIKLTSGQTVQARLPQALLNANPVGAKVMIHEFLSLIFRKRSYRAELIELRPNNSFKPTPLRGAA